MNPKATSRTNASTSCNGVGGEGGGVEKGRGRTYSRFECPSRLSSEQRTTQAGGGGHIASRAGKGRATIKFQERSYRRKSPVARFPVLDKAGRELRAGAEALC